MKKISLILLVLFSVITFGQGMKFEENKSFKDLLAIAKKENRLLFLDAYTSWCGPCKMMAKNVFPQANVGEFYNANFINSKIDMEKGEGIELAKKYNVRAYPTYLFINGDGEIIHRVTSYYDPEDFINVGKDAIDPSKQMGALKKKFEAGEKDPEFLKSFIKVYAYTDPVLATKVARTYFDGKKAEPLSQEDLNFLFGLTKDSNSPLFQEFISRKDELVKLMPEENYNRTITNFKLNGIFNNSFDQTSKVLDEKKFITEAKKMMTEEKANAMLLKAKMKIAASAKDTAGYQKYALDYYKDGTSPEFTSDELNTVSWNFFEGTNDKAALGKALLWAKQSVKLAPGYANTDTVANIYFKLGDKTNTKEWATKAIELAKKEGEDYAETQALLDKSK